MANLNKTFLVENFVQNADGLYEASILGTLHNFGTHFHMARALLRDENNTWHNTVTPYEISANGDLKIFVTEPGIYRVTIVQD